ncbi:MAG: tetratricopeptide repeat protein [Ktedonobacterales bacterium]|nr:tetratricopeptide repeat protein [Ktedonobacterales bacterium]
MSKKKSPKHPRRPAIGQMVPAVARELRAAEALMEREQWAEARARLEPLADRFPMHAEVVRALAFTFYQLEGMPRYMVLCERLHRLVPEDAETTLALATAYLATQRIALTVRTLRHFLTRWPRHPRTDHARELLAEVEPQLAEILAEMGLTGEDGAEVAAWHEEALGLIEQGDYAQGRRLEERVLERRPDFTAALNNINLSYTLEGRLEDALTANQRVLANAPQNVHALSNLTRTLCLAGRIADARTWAARLKEAPANSPEAWVKKAEALSFLGDNDGVLEALAQAKQAGYAKPPLLDPLGAHLAAVACWRVGREREARRWWKQALNLVPAFDLAQANLDDLRKPVGARHAPWPFGLSYWMSAKMISDLRAAITPLIAHQDVEATAQALRGLLRAHPSLAALVPLLLDHGDPVGRELGLHLAEAAGDATLLAALRDFALSQRGPDSQRMAAARVASSAGLLPSEPIRMWWEGEWRELVLLAFEVDGEPVEELPQEVATRLIEGIEALRNGDAPRAEVLFRQADALAPDIPSIQNNLVALYEAQNHAEEAEALARQIHVRFPDNLIAAANVARLAALRGDTSEAAALLDPLLMRQRLHISELRVLCAAEIERYLVEKDTANATTWLELWTALDPEHPALDYMRLRLNLRAIMERSATRKPRRPTSSAAARP